MIQIEVASKPSAALEPDRLRSSPFWIVCSRLTARAVIAPCFRVNDPSVRGFNRGLELDDPSLETRDCILAKLPFVFHVRDCGCGLGCQIFAFRGQRFCCASCQSFDLRIQLICQLGLRPSSLDQACQGHLRGAQVPFGFANALFDQFDRISIF